uniref:Putative cyclic nucleotide-gated ion channel 9 n=1 Tax=Anthurium amnicola TaxID=1678845 RepID=A0A1D1YUE1_9ARAE
MDVDARKPHGLCDSGQTFPALDGGCVDKDEKEEEDGERESKSLLAVKLEAPKRQRSKRRKVQWNDRHGNKLVEVLEFQPSDSSDSDEDDFADSCVCAIM